MEEEEVVVVGEEGRGVEGILVETGAPTFSEGESVCFASGNRFSMSFSSLIMASYSASVTKDCERL